MVKTQTVILFYPLNLSASFTNKICKRLGSRPKRSTTLSEKPRSSLLIFSRWTLITHKPGKRSSDFIDLSHAFTLRLREVLGVNLWMLVAMLLLRNKDQQWNICSRKFRTSRGKGADMSELCTLHSDNQCKTRCRYHKENVLFLSDMFRSEVPPFVPSVKSNTV